MTFNHINSHVKVSSFANEVRSALNDNSTNSRCTACGAVMEVKKSSTCDSCIQKDRTRRANKGFRDTLAAYGIEDPMDLYWAICEEAPQTSSSTLIKLKKLLLNLPRKAIK